MWQCECGGLPVLPQAPPWPIALPSCRTSQRTDPVRKNDAGTNNLVHNIPLSVVIEPRSIDRATLRHRTDQGVLLWDVRAQNILRKGGANTVPFKIRSGRGAIVHHESPIILVPPMLVCVTIAGQHLRSPTAEHQAPRCLETWRPPKEVDQATHLAANRPHN